MKKTLVSLLLLAALAAPAEAMEVAPGYYRGKYTVRFLANGGTGTMKKQTFKVAESKRLRANAFKRSGYVFAGWANSKAGGIVFRDRESVVALGSPGETVKLYAAWANPTYRVAFVANGGTGTMKKQSFAYGTAKKLRANAFERSGYEFVGWAKSKAKAEKGKVAYKDQKSVKNLTRAGGTVKLYAVWRKK